MALQWIVALGVPAAFADAELFGLSMGLYGVVGGLAGGLGILIWWLFFSRARWPERLGALVVLILAVVAARSMAHVSIAEAGMGLFF